MATVSELIGILRLRGGNEFSREIKSKAAQVRDSFLTIQNAVAGAGLVFFLRNVNDAANRAQNAMLGLQSVAKFKGIEGAEAAAQQLDAVRAGLMSSFDAAAALKNLLGRGYNLNSAVQTLNALSNSAAFGRVAHLSLGEAVVTATEGLKNENSILVDNAGVTKNISVIWKEYADSIGVGVNSLTQEQKIQAEVNGILRETQAQMGDLIKLANSEAGAQARLAAARDKASVSLGQMVQTISAPFISLLTDMVEAFNIMPRGLQNAAVALGAVTTAAYLFGGALRVLLPMIGPVGWVLTGLSVAAGLFFGLQNKTSGAAKSIDEVSKSLQGFRESLTKLSAAEAIMKLIWSRAELRSVTTAFENAAFNAPHNQVNKELTRTLLNRKKQLETEIQELQKFVLEINAHKDQQQVAQTAQSQEQIRAQEIAFTQERQMREQESGEAILTIRRQGFDGLLKLHEESGRLALVKFNEISAAMQAAAEAHAQKVMDQAMFIRDAVISIGGAMAESLRAQGNVFKAFFKNVLMTAIDAIDRYFILARIKTLLDAVINPFAALKSIAPLAIASGLLQVAKSQIAALADGALITQPTLALLGERRQPEIVAPERDFMSYSNALIDRVLGERGAGRSGGEVNMTLNFNTPLNDRRTAERLTQQVLKPEVRREVRRRRRVRNELVVDNR